MNKLRPCPFCGYPAVFEPFKERKGYASTIRCCNCPAEITTITYDTAEEAEMEAIEAWNRRVNEVVRCKNCEEFDDDDLTAGKKTYFCYIHGENFPRDYFCASAERRKK